MPEIHVEPTRKEQILATALDLMYKNGYQGTSMRDIAAAVQMEAASLYNHIQGKEDILKDTCFTMASRFILGMKEINDIYFNGAEKLAMAVRNHVKILTESRNASWMFIHEWRNLNAESKAEFIALRNQYEQEFITILQNGQEEGTFNIVDNKFAALTILSSLNWVVEWYNPKGKMNYLQIAQKLTDFIFQGLKK